MDRPCNAGFTIIEVLVVIAIIGIIGAMALPAFAQMLENNRRVAAVNDLLSSFHVARSEAITRNQRISVCASNAGQTACEAGAWQKGWLIFRDVDGDGVFDSVDGDDILRVGTGLRGNMGIVSDEFAGAVTFLSNGRVAGTGGMMLLCADGVTNAVRRIDIDRTGRPRSIATTADSCE